MAVPFRRKSSTRIKKGRSPSNWRLAKRFSNWPLIKCFSCKQTKLLHRVCSNCLTTKK